MPDKVVFVIRVDAKGAVPNMKKISTELTKLMTNIGFTKDIMEDVQPAIDKFSQSFKALAPAIKEGTKGVATNFNKTSKALVKLISNFGFTEELLRDLTPLIDRFAEEFKKISPEIKEVIDTFGDLSTLVKTLNFSKLIAQINKLEKEKQHLADTAKKTSEQVVKANESMLDKAGAAARKLAEGLQKSFANIGQSLLKLAKDIISGALVKSLNLAKSSLQGIVTSVQNVAKSIAKFGIDSVNAASDLDDSLSGVRKTANLTSSQVDQLAKSVRDLSVEELKGVVSTEDLGEILEIAGQQGILTGDAFEKTSETALKFAGDVAKMATALDLSFSKAADRLSAFNSAFGGIPENIGNVANAFNVLADSTQANVGPMLEMARYLAPVVSQMPILQSDVIGLIGALSELKVGPQQASTALSSLFKKMSSDTKAFAEAFEIDFDKLNKLVQKDTTAAFELLLKNINKMKESGPEGIQLVSQALKELSLTGPGVSTVLLGLSGLGENLRTNFLDPAAEGITNMDSITKEFNNTTQRLSAIWKGLGAILTDIKVIIGTDIVTALETITGSNIRDLALQFREWLESSKFIKEFLPEALQRIVDIVDILTIKAIQVADSFRFDGAKDAADSFFITLDNIKEWLATLPADVIRQKIEDGFRFAAKTAKKFFDLVSDGFQNMQTIIEGGKTVWNGLKLAVEGVKIAIDTIKSTASDLVGIFGPIISEIVGAFGGAAETIIGAFRILEHGLGAVGATARTIISSIISVLTGDFEGALRQLKDGMAKVGNRITSMFDGLKSFFSGIVKVIKNGLGLIGSLTSAIGKVTGKVKQLGDLATGNSVFPDMFNSIGDNISALTGLDAKIANTTKTMEELGMVSTGNSVLPDMLEALDKNNEAFGSLRGRIQQATGDLDKLKDTALFFDNLGDVFATTILTGESRRALYDLVRNSRADVLRAEAALQDLLVQQQILFQQAQLQATSQNTQTSGFQGLQPQATIQDDNLTVPPQLAEQSNDRRTVSQQVVINLNGNNIVDENSTERFASRIGAILREQNALLISA